jgi:DNA helicase II / ATP-dependent DNA helicase PcrA
MSSLYLKASDELRENPGQWTAYESKGHCVVLAGPGSGKTKTLTIKLARMLAEDVKGAQGIACITYSNECARELKRRLHQLGIEDRDRRVFIGTVHSFALKNVLVPFGSLGGLELPGYLQVATPIEQRQMFGRAITRVFGQSARADQFKVQIDAYRRTHLDRRATDWNEYADFAAVIVDYEKELRSVGLIDFDDMMLLGLRLIESHEWIRRAVKAKFPILAVDEYQDLGVPLHRMVMQLCFRAGVRLFAVGDADQSIYGFIGAKPELLRRLSERPDVTAVRLPFNYRSAPEIVAAAEVALGEQRGYSARRAEKGIVAFHYFPGGLEDQINGIINTLVPEALERDPNRRLGDIAIVYTNYSDGNIASQAATGAGLEFVRIDSGSPIPATPIVRWLEDCAEWCAGGWKRSEPKLQALIAAWLRFNASIRQPVDQRELQRSLVRYLFAHRNSDETFRSWLESIRDEVLQPCFAREGTLRDEVNNVAAIMQLTEEGKELENATIATFSGKAGSPRHLNLITLHSVKGLEYDVVFLLGMDQGRMPSWSDNTPDKSAEARRLFYVGVTRARREVHLTYSGFTENKSGRRFDNGPSPFLLELRQRVGAEMLKSAPCATPNPRHSAASYRKSASW